MKDEVRRNMRRLRSLFKGDDRTKSDKSITQNFLAAFGNYNSFFIYNSFGSETDTSAIINELIKRGKSVYLPRVEGGNIAPVPFGETRAGAFGIAEPVGQAYSGEIEVTAIPLLAVNSRGFRAGYGKGFYDRYLKGAKTVKVGLCYNYQIAEFKQDEWDEPLDFLVTESGVKKYENNQR